MEKDTPLKQWEDGVSLGSAWWVYADLQKKKRFRELQQAASRDDPAPHMGFRHVLEDEVIGRLSSGELQAFGIVFGSSGEPIVIPKNYFWKGAEIDLDNDTVAALGRKFGQVTVKGKREPIAETLPEMMAVDPQEILAKFTLTAARELPDDRGAIGEPISRAESRPSEAAPQELIKETRRGRPSKENEIEEAIDLLLRNGVDLAKMPRPIAYEKVRECAKSDLNSDTDIGFADPVIQRFLFRRFGPRR
jgi:hypothetical protein